MRFSLFALAWFVCVLPAPAAPVDILPAELRGAVQPQVAVSASGRVHVVFGKDNAIFHTTSPDGLVFSPPQKVGSLEKLALRMRRGPRVTATDSLVLVSAISHADGNLHAWTSSDNGGTWTEGAPLNTADKSAREGLHSLTGDGRGLAAVVWLDLRGGAMEIRGRFSRDGGATWGPDLSVYQSPDGHVCECCVPNAAISERGEIAVMWRNWLGGSRDLFLSKSGDGGATFSPAQKLGAGTWKLAGCPMDGGGLVYAPGSSGDWRAVWRRDKTVFSSSAQVPETQLATSAAQAAVGFAGKTPLALWESGGALILQRGNSEPARFADSAAAVSMARAGESAAAVWEGVAAKTIFFEWVR